MGHDKSGATNQGKGFTAGVACLVTTTLLADRCLCTITHAGFWKLQQTYVRRLLSHNTLQAQTEITNKPAASTGLLHRLCLCFSAMLGRLPKTVRKGTRALMQQ